MSVANKAFQILGGVACPAGQGAEDKDRMRCLLGEDVLGTIGRPVDIARSMPVFLQGDIASHFYRVESGAVRRCRLLADGRRQVTGFYFPGDIFALGDSGVYLDDAEAICDALVLQVGHAELEQMDIGQSCLAQRLLGQTRRELREAQELMLMLGRASVRQRMAWFLVSMASRLGRVGRLMPVFELPMARIDIADYLGLTPETVSRILGELKREGVIAVPTTQRIVISDEAALRQMVEDMPSIMTECGFTPSRARA